MRLTISLCIINRALRSFQLYAINIRVCARNDYMARTHITNAHSSYVHRQRLSLEPFIYVKSGRCAGM